MMKMRQDKKSSMRIVGLMFWGLFVYNKVFLRKIDGLSYGKSWLIMNTMMLLVCILLCCFIGKRRANSNAWRIVSVVVGGAFLYQYYFLFSRIACGLIAIYLLGAGFFIFAMLDRQRKSGKGINIRKILETYFCWSSFFILAIVTPIITLYLLTGVWGGSSKSITVNDKEFIEKSEESIDAIKFINQVDWEKLDLMQKMEFCQELTDMLSQRLGLCERITVVANDLEEGTNACYSHSNRVIYVSIDYLNEEEFFTKDICNTIAHEVYHSYEHDQVDMLSYLPEKYKKLYLLNRANEYKITLDNYIDGKENYYEYYNQSVEVDSREYGRIIQSQFFPE